MNCTTCGLPVEPGSACCDDHHMYDEDCIAALSAQLAAEREKSAGLARQVTAGRIKANAELKREFTESYYRLHAERDIALAAQKAAEEVIAAVYDEARCCEGGSYKLAIQAIKRRCESALAPQAPGAERPKVCGVKMGGRPEWMSPGQYDPCFCKRTPGHKGKHACEHENAELLAPAAERPTCPECGGAGLEPLGAHAGSPDICMKCNGTGKAPAAEPEEGGK